MNEVIVVFDEEPLADDPAGFNSATNPKNWDIASVDPSIPSTADPSILYIPEGEVVPTYTPGIGECLQDEDDPKQIRVIMQGPLEGGVRYDVVAQPALRGDGCRAFAGEDTWRVRAPRRGPGRRSRYIQEDRYRDWAMEFFPDPKDQLGGTWRHDADGDIAIHDGDESLKKRIVRRIMTSRGDYAHLPNYGVDLQIKRLARAGQVQALVNEVGEQVRQEPDVLQAGVTATVLNTPNKHSIELQIFVRRRERFDSRFTFEVPLGR